MSHHHASRSSHVGRAGWFAIGALAASIAFVAMLLSRATFSTLRAADDVKAELPALVIEGN